MASWYDSFLSQFNQGGSPMQGGSTQPMQSSTPFMDNLLNFQRQYGGNANYGAPGSPETTGGLMAASPMTTGGNQIDQAMTSVANNPGGFNPGGNTMNRPQSQVGSMSPQTRDTLGQLSDYFGGGLGPKSQERDNGFGWAGGRNNFSKVAGSIAQAISPNSFGGRLGGLAANIAHNDEQSRRSVDHTLMTGFMRQLGAKQNNNVQAFKPGDYIKQEGGTYYQFPDKPTVEKNAPYYPENSFVKQPDGSFKRVGGEKEPKAPNVRDNFMAVTGGVIDKEGNFRMAPPVEKGKTSPDIRKNFMTIPGGFIDAEGNVHMTPKAEKDQTPAERKEAREAEGAAAVVGGIPTQPPGIREIPGTGWIWNDKVTVPSEEQQVRDQFAPIIAAEKNFERKALLQNALNKRIDEMRISNKNVPMPTRSQVEGRPGETSNAVPDVVAPPIGPKQGTPGKKPSRVSQLENFSPAAADYVKQFGGPPMKSKRR